MLCLCSSTAWIQLACAFRYGRDDLDVIGLSFRKDIWFQHIQLYPPADHKPSKTAMHEALMSKAGDQGIPFTFNVMSYSDVSLRHFVHHSDALHSHPPLVISASVILPLLDPNKPALLCHTPARRGGQGQGE